MKFFNFLTQKKFYINLVIIIALVLLILWMAFRMLGTYTRHGEEFIVPDFTGENFDKVTERYKNDFRFVLNDSIYSNAYDGGTIVQQDPLPGLKVKQGRHIYFVIVAQTPEMTSMPNLRNLSLRQALVLLRHNGLEINKLNYVDYFAQNAVIEQYCDTTIVEPGTQLLKGSKVNLKVGNGNAYATTVFPNIVGAYYKDVRNTLANASLNVGKEVFASDDDMKYMRVYRTEPKFEHKLQVPLGTQVKIWYRSETRFDFATYIYNLHIQDSIEQARLLEQKIAADTTDSELNNFMGEDEYIKEVLDGEDDVF